MNQITIPFGKHHGLTASQLESAYLLWISGQVFVKVKHPKLLHECLIEIQKRLNNGRLMHDLLDGRLDRHDGGLKTLPCSNR